MNQFLFFVDNYEDFFDEVVVFYGVWSANFIIVDSFGFFFDGRFYATGHVLHKSWLDEVSAISYNWDNKRNLGN